MAVFYGIFKKVEQLLAAGVDVNVKNNMGTTPLKVAVHFNRIDLVKLLIENGARVTEEEVETAHAKKDIYEYLQKYRWRNVKSARKN